MIGAKVFQPNSPYIHAIYRTPLPLQSHVELNSNSHTYLHHCCGNADAIHGDGETGNRTELRQTLTWRSGGD